MKGNIFDIQDKIYAGIGHYSYLIDTMESVSEEDKFKYKERMNGLKEALEVLNSFIDEDDIKEKNRRAEIERDRLLHDYFCIT